MKNTEEDEQQRMHSRERRVFAFLAIVLAPMLAVAIVGAYGFSIWLFQIFAGPPTG